MPAPQQNHFPLLAGFTAALTSSAYAKWQQLVDDYAHRAELAGECRRLADLAFTGRDAAARAHLHEVLAVVYAHEFSQSAARNPDQDSQPVLCDVTSILENAMLEHEFGQIPEELLSGYPTGGKEYVRWLKALIQDHPASTHPMYAEHLPTVATAEDIRFLLAQETSLDPRFDDILAVMQLGATGAEKMEIAANYWDEMGNGEFADVHTTLFSQCLTSIGVDQDYVEQNLLPIAKECGNISAGLALSRRHYLRAIGYYGVTEFLAPRRFRQLVTAWDRLGLPPEGKIYHDIHINIDAHHAAGWYKNVIGPVVERDPAAGREVALGTFVRLNTSAQYLDRVLEVCLKQPQPA
ncbi:iron-containing redox enzyme family protein [Streptomyces samsunensis]|nr:MULTISPECIES: iron-containing redox enzyme family protein [Streptomyces]MCQ6248637.1 iron-containing redox enzyme family protein [Streptomyces malaysiensis]NUH41918.1 iron-containing redox enzyme family protein [Streptomyces samsunensis]